jgi:hypothetical protein
MGTEESAGPATADEELAGLIVDDLVAAGLIDSSTAKKVLPKLVSGKLKSEDWRLWLSPDMAPQTEEDQ